ncbi:hypothetical protein KCU92_g242, partial [Aureobasidium melanogenum]
MPAKLGWIDQARLTDEGIDVVFSGKHQEAQLKDFTCQCPNCGLDLCTSHVSIHGELKSSSHHLPQWVVEVSMRILRTRYCRLASVVSGKVEGCA